MPAKLILTCATRENAENFVHTEFGKSTARMRGLANVARMIMVNNSNPLATLYNQAIDKAGNDDWLVFVHDDVAIDDFHLYQRLEEAFQHFDLIGVAGNTRTGPNHVAWCYDMDPETGKLIGTFRQGSGAVYHSATTAQCLSNYGKTPQACQIMDGCFLATKVSTLRKFKIRFDPQFPFHFYDVDFCRQFLKAGLRVGTWPIAVSHASAGNFGSAAWQATLPRYREKWKHDAWVSPEGNRE
jgi:GT2 family glycosyltransferase